MNIQIIGDNFNVSSRTQKMVDSKVKLHLGKLLTRYNPEELFATLHINKDKLDNFNLKFDMNLPGRKDVFAETTHKILKSALIDITQEIERQIERYH